MDYPVKSGSSDLDAAVVVWANRFQFAPGEVIINCEVESRMLLWRNAGTGWVEIHGRTIEFTPTTCILLPWRSTATYRADPHDPLMVSALHIIPWHDLTVPVRFHAAQAGDSLTGVPYRRDIDWRELRGIVHLTVDGRDRLVEIANVTVEHIQEGRPDRASLHALAVLLVNELRAAVAQPRTMDADVPPNLLRMQEYITGHLHQRLTVGRIADTVGVSEATAERVFCRYTGTSVGRWIIAKRMSVARERLRSTNASVAQVARSVGFDDPSYFSRVFRRTQGVPPSTYTSRSRLA